MLAFKQNSATTKSNTRGSYSVTAPMLVLSNNEELHTGALHSRMCGLPLQPPLMNVHIITMLLLSKCLSGHHALPLEARCRLVGTSMELGVLLLLYSFLWPVLTSLSTPTAPTKTHSPLISSSCCPASRGMFTPP